MIKQDKQLLEIWDNKEESYKSYWDYEDLPHEDKMKIWKLIEERSKKI